RIWQEHELKPHRQKSFKLSRDPKFVEKLLDVVGIYLNPCRAYGICLDSQSRGYLGKDRKVSSAAGGNLSRMHKTQETAKESRLNFMYSHLRNRTLAAIFSLG